MELRSANNALKFMVEQKDEVIEKLMGEKEELKNSFALGHEEEVMRLRQEHRELEKLYQQEQKENEKLRDHIDDLTN